MNDVAAEYEPYTTTVDPDDTTFDTLILERVEPFKDGHGWSVTSTEGWGCVVPNFGNTPTPRPGDELRTYGSIGRPIQGQVLNGHVIWYRTAEQRVVHRAQELARFAAERRERFERERDALDARYEALPAPFKARIDRFRAEDPQFRVDSESYESFVLQQAALLAGQFKDEGRIIEWAEIKDYEEQMRTAPDGWSDGHSGNTHGCAIRMAVALLRGESV